MQRKQIALYGYGYVGKAVFSFLKDHYDVVIIDPLLTQETAPPECSAWLTSPATNDNSHGLVPDHAIVCVPTPTDTREGAGAACDTSIVEEILRNTDHKSYLVKSTVTPGTIDRLTAETGKRICHSPEYIGEGKYEVPFWKDFPHPTNMKLHTFHIFGGPRDVTKEWVEIFQRVAGWTPTYAQTTAKTSECVKYFENMFLATKKVFCDEMYNVCQALGIDYNEAKELWLLDARIGRPMTLIFPDARGFSGKCLPKDTAAIVAAAKEAGYDAKLWREVIASNARVRGEQTEAAEPAKV